MFKPQFKLSGKECRKKEYRSKMNKPSEQEKRGGVKGQRGREEEEVRGDRETAAH